MGGWCSGNTSVFGTAVGGSIPSLPDDNEKAWSAEFEKSVFFLFKDF